MLYDDDCIVNVAALHEAVAEKEFKLVEEYECPACSDLFDIVDGRVPMCCLNAKDSGTEVDLEVV